MYKDGKEGVDWQKKMRGGGAHFKEYIYVLRSFCFTVFLVRKTNIRFLVGRGLDKGIKVSNVGLSAVNFDMLQNFQ